MTKTGKILSITLILAIAAPLAVSAQGSGARHHVRQERGHDRGERHGVMLRQILKAYDTNGDRALTQEEIDTGRAAQLAAADANGDGALSLDEYQNLWLAVMRERMVDDFQRHDADGDSVVTGEEFSARFDSIVARMDRNGDGALSAEDRRGRRPAE